MKFLLLRKNREDPNGSTWTLFVTERSQRHDQRPSRDAERGVATREALQQRAREWSPESRDRHEQELADRLDARPAGRQKAKS